MDLDDEPKVKRQPDPREPPQAKLLAVLKHRYPALFDASGSAVLPLAIGIDRQISVAVEGEFTEQQVRRLLKWWCRRTSYTAALARNEHRYGLAGEVAGEVRPEERHAAAASLKAKHKAMAGQVAPGGLS